MAGCEWKAQNAKVGQPSHSEGLPPTSHQRSRDISYAGRTLRRDLRFPRFAVMIVALASFLGDVTFEVRANGNEFVISVNEISVRQLTLMLNWPAMLSGRQ